MKLYPSQLLQNHLQKCFNNALSKSSRAVENAFGHLKALYRRIGKGIDNALRNANRSTLVCMQLMGGDGDEAIAMGDDDNDRNSNRYNNFTTKRRNEELSKDDNSNYNQH
ncbi:hypothetical protein DOY81_008169 [Sarcophaga bullata]|nr:hypothetical protein DOY81_008169 [Sarcophaga bullata]